MRSPRNALLSTHALAILVTAAAIGYVAVALWSGWPAVVEGARRIGYSGVLVALSCASLNIVLRFVRWRGYMDLWKIRAGVAATFKIYVAGLALTATPGGAGEPVLRAILLKPFAVGYSKTVASYIVERVSDLICFVLIALIGLSAYPPARSFIVVVATLIAAFIALLLHARVLVLLREALHDRQGRIARMLYHGIDVLAHSRECFTARQIVRGLVLGVAAWLANAVICWYFAQRVGSDIGALNAMFVYTFSALVGALSFLPGGLGTAEAAMISLLVFHGLPAPLAVVVTVLHRAVTLWYSVAIGIVCYYASMRDLSHDDPGR